MMKAPLFFAIIGLVLGLIIGGVFGYYLASIISLDIPEHKDWAQAQNWLLFGPVIGAFLGLFIGALIGYFIMIFQYIIKKRSVKNK